MRNTLLRGWIATLCVCGAACGIRQDGLGGALTVGPGDSGTTQSGGSGGSGGAGGSSTGGQGGSAGAGGSGGTSTGGTGGTGMGSGGQGGNSMGTGGQGGGHHNGGTGGTANGGQGGTSYPDGGQTVDAEPAGPGDASADSSPAVYSDGSSDEVSTPPPADAGAETGPGVGTIQCGIIRCNIATEVCCASGAVTSCARRDVGCGAGSVRRCDGPEDCTGEKICCVEKEVLGGYRTACLKPDDCKSTGGEQICRAAEDCQQWDNGTCVSTNQGGTAINTCQW